MEASFELSSPIQLGLGRRKLIRNRNTNTPGENNLKIHVDNMTEEQLEQVLGTIPNGPNHTTIVDNNGIDHNNINTDVLEYENTNPQIRRYTRIRSTNPITRLGNRITH